MSKFTFDGHEYELVDGKVLDSGGELVCSAGIDLAGEYWIVDDGRDCYMPHVNDCTMLDAVKAFISSTY